MKNPKFLFTGGHITPAIAVADELHKQMPDCEILFVGRQTSLEGSNTPSEESRIVRGRGFRFIPLQAGRVTRAATFNTLVSLVKIPIGFFQAFAICQKVEPDLIISFGGYVALPIVICGWLLGIPSITHEQTRTPGLANKIIGLFAKQILVSFPETAHEFWASKTIVTGLPLRDSIFHPPKNPPFSYDKSKPLLFISGGSTGSTSVNDHVFAILPDLLELGTIVHQTGHVDAKRAKYAWDELSKDDQMRYMHFPYIDEDMYSWVFHEAKLVIGRSGANTVGEIAALGKVALLIPLPWSGGGEQYSNAQYLVDGGTSEIVDQKELSTLVETIKKILANYDQMKSNAAALSQTFPRDGVQKIVENIRKILPDANTRL